MAKIKSWLSSILLDRNIYWLGIVSLATFTLAYQVTLPIHLQIGGVLDRPYVVNFQAPQKEGQGRYRLTRTLSMLVLPGLGGGVPRRVSIRSRLATPERPTRLSIEIQTQKIADRDATAQWQTDTYIIDSGPALSAVNWVITFFARPAEGQNAKKIAVQKNSKVAISDVLIEPVVNVGGRWEAANPIDPRRFVVPGPMQLIVLTAAVLTLYVLLVALQVQKRWAVMVAGAALFAFALLLALARFYLTVFSPTLAMIVVGSALSVALAAPLVPRLYHIGGLAITRRDLNPVLMVFFVALVLKLGGAFYPQFISSDLLYHQHRWERVLQGELFFLTSSPEFGNLDIPLAPGYYVFLAPLNTLFQERYLILKFASVFFDTTSIFFIAYLAFKFARSARVAWIAALVYTVTPITFLMLSAGNLPNIFSQWLLLALVVVVLGGYDHLRDRRVWLVVVFLYVVAGISHIGNLIVMTTLLVTFAAVLMLWSPDAESRPQARALLLAVVVGATLTFLLYYIDFTALLLSEFVGLLQKKFSGGLRVAGTLNFAKVPVAISNAVIAGGLLGTVIAWREQPALLKRALVAWFVSAALFVAIAQFAGIYVRYNIYVLPALSIGVGLGCAWLARRGIRAYFIVALYLAYVIWVGLSFWYVRVMFAYH
ncbi:MAG: hypothetical protein HY741_06930 [Chloroflexi bacterium]|nr:hypothetical protein [Chloroflexota bacterium]